MCQIWPIHVQIGQFGLYFICNRSTCWTLAITEMGHTGWRFPRSFQIISANTLLYWFSNTVFVVILDTLITNTTKWSYYLCTKLRTYKCNNLKYKKYWIDRVAWTPCLWMFYRNMDLFQHMCTFFSLKYLKEGYTLCGHILPTNDQFNFPNYKMSLQEKGLWPSGMWVGHQPKGCGFKYELRHGVVLALSV